MKETIYKAKWIVTGVRNRYEADVIENGALLQRDGKIMDIGRFDDIAARHPDADVYGSDVHMMLPGFVNSHHHVGMTPLQMGSPDHPLELWFASRMASRDLDRYLDTLYSAFEMIASGITTVQHIHGWMPGPLANIQATSLQVLKAYRDIGMRASYCYAVREQNRLVYEADEEFVARVPTDLAPTLAAYLKKQAIPFDDNLALYDALVTENAGQARTRIQLAPANLHWCSDHALSALQQRSDRDQVPMHMHLLETAYQKEYARRRTGTTAVKHLYKLGLLGPRLTLGHGVWLTQEDIEIAADTGTCLCHNCSSNFRLRSGVAPLNAFEAKGMTVGIGLDEAGINDDRDMLQEMRMVLRAHRTPGMDDSVPTCPQVLRMATEHGAMTTPFGSEIGRLEIGRQADFVMIDTHKALYPYQDSDVPILDAVMQRAKMGAVDATVVAGEVIYEKGKFIHVDRDQVLKEIAERLSRPRSEDEVQRQKLSQAVFPHVKKFYEGYLDGEQRSPFYGPSSSI
ncbi:MAG: amidohydrolase family protein [Herminiimonas sp.]|nr:amidohydrolase family protein [Herminiimonas sp.]